jgi:hypothetical protein
LDALPNQLKSLWGTARVVTGDYSYSRGDKESPVLNLQGQLKTALWPTANCPNGGRTLSAEDVLNKGNTSNGKRQVDLRNLLKVVLWPSPTKSDKPNGINNNPNKSGSTSPPASEHSLTTRLGQTLNGSNASMAKAGPSFAALQLTFTSWLMNYPIEYLANFGPSASPPLETPSSGRSRARSSKP